MPYTTLDQLSDRYGSQMLIGLTDRSTPATDAVDVDVVTRALVDTDAVIDGYLATRYRLPMATTPPLIADLAQAIAIWKLHTYEPDPKIKTDYEAAIRALEKISSGVIRLNIEGAPPSGTGGSGARATDRDRPMTAENLKGFI